MGIRIKQLPTLVANQIAAGEVIERPASVVKELLENSLDAAASHVLIEIGFGGLNQIKISDDGIGIEPDDLTLAIAPHATSKITKVDDLYAIGSMGFRGEALASIASVAKMSISSKTSKQDHAMLLTAQDDSVHLSACARNQGTTIEVRDLFYNVPVRKKFLKTERLEFLAIEAVVRRFAMSAPQIALTLKHNGKNVLQLPSAKNDKTQYARMVKLFGQSFAKDAIYLEVKRSGMTLSGWISGPNYQRSQNDRQWVYVNQRMVKDKLILHAIKQVYEDRIHPGRFPSCLLYFTLPVGEVDVNVHPTKHEVRFQQPRLVHDFFSSQLLDALNARPQGDVLPSVQGEGAEAAYEQKTSEINEASPRSFLQSAAPTLFPMDQSWIGLNKRYALVLFDKKTQLVDVLRLHQHWMKAELSTAPRPLPSRPLLIPLTYPIDAETAAELISHQAAFLDLGIEFELKERNLHIRSLPLLMPQLDLLAWVQGLMHSFPAEQDLLSSLLACQHVDAEQLSREEKEELMGHLQRLDTKQSLVSKIAIVLDETACEGMFMRGEPCLD